MRSIALAIPALLLAASSAFAGDTAFSLSDRAANAHITLTGPAAGMDSLVVDDGVSRLRYQAFFFRRLGMENEANISALALTGSQATDTNPFTDDSDDTLVAQYTGPGLRIEPTWVLRGSAFGTGKADVGEAISIINTGETPLVISFFQYSNFTLGGSRANPTDVVTITGPGHNTAQQTGDAGFLSETVVTPAPSHWATGDAATLLALLNNGSIDNMPDSSGPAGPGDVAWVFQWDLTIPVGGTIIISKDKSLIPTPGAAAVMALGGLTVARRRRR